MFKILEQVDLGLAASQYSPDIFEYRWFDEETACPKLVIKTRLPFLAELISSESATPVSKGHIREVLLVLQKKLGILEDNRVKTQGSDIWDFTLKLWDTSPNRNLRKFEQLWTQHKSGQLNKKIAKTPDLTTALVQTPGKKRLLHNLTLRPESPFIDTQSGLSELMATLSDPKASSIVSIVGPGGIGKTTLALEAAHRCLNQRSKQSPTSSLPEFDVITFVSAQPREFLGPYLSERWQADRTLKGIIREILKTVDCAERAPLDLVEKIDYVYRILREHRTLLILDNLETVTDPNRLLSFIHTLPKTVKVILTSRTRFGVGKSIELTYLSSESGEALIKQQAKQKLLDLKASQVQEIYQLSGGLPLAMAYSVGYLSVHRHLPTLKSSHHNNQPPSEIAQYCVAAALDQLKKPSDQKLLMAATLFTEKFSVKAAAYIADLPHPSEGSCQGFSSLYRLSLINKLDEVYYSMHAFTQEFMRTRLEENLTFKQAAQARWVDWYLKFLSPLAEDWFDWQDYTELEMEWNNIRTLVNWCIETEDYKTFHKLWLGLRGYTLTRGYWEERQAWMEILLWIAKEQNDSFCLAEAMFYQGQTLLYSGSDEDAVKLLQNAWKLREKVEPDVQFGILTCLVSSCLRQNQYDEAKIWLSKRNCIPESSQFNKEQKQCLYYSTFAEIAQQQGRQIAAESDYRKALDLAEKAQWKKMIAYIRVWLAPILLRRSEYGEAEHMLAEALQSARLSQDKSLISTCYYRLAVLAERRGNRDLFRKWARLAKNEFEKLGMTASVNQLDYWLNSKSL